MSRPFVSALGGNAKGGVSAHLGPKTLVVGRNGTGKTAIGTTLKLALTGRDDDLGATPSALMRLAPGKATAMEARARVQRGDVVEDYIFHVEGSTARAKRPEWTCGERQVAAPVGALLAVEVRDLFARSEKAQREALVRITVGDIDEKAITEAIPVALRQEWLTFWQQATGDTVADRLVDAVERLRSEARAVARVAKASEEDAPQAPSDIEVDGLRQQLQAATLAAEVAQRRQEAERELPALRERAQALRDAVAQERVAAGVDALKEQVALAKLRADAMEAAVKQFDLMIASHARGLKVVCTTCEAEIPDTNALVARRARAYQRAQATAQLFAEAQEALQEARARQSSEPEAIRVKARIDTYEAVLAQEVRVWGGRSREDLSEAVADAMRRQALAAEHKRQRDASAAAGSRAIVLKGLAQTAEALAARLLDGAIADFEERGTLALPEGVKLAVKLIDKGKPCCRAGLEVGGEFRSWHVLCGAERALCVAAFASAWAAARGEDLRIVLVDEVSLDARSLAALCDGLGRVVDAGTGPTQAIVCVIDDYGAAPMGWQVVRLQEAGDARGA